MIFFFFHGFFWTGYFYVIYIFLIIGVLIGCFQFRASLLENSNGCVLHPLLIFQLIIIKKKTKCVHVLTSGIIKVYRSQLELVWSFLFTMELAVTPIDICVSYTNDTTRLRYDSNRPVCTNFFIIREDHVWVVWVVTKTWVKDIWWLFSCWPLCKWL